MSASCRRSPSPWRRFAGHVVAWIATALAGPALAQSGLTATMGIQPQTIRSGAFAQIVVALGNASSGSTIGGIAFDVAFPPTMLRKGTPVLAQCGGTVTETPTGYQFRNGSLGTLGQCTVIYPVTVEQDDDGDVSVAIDEVRSTNGGSVRGLAATVHVIGGIPPTITSPPPPSRGYVGLPYVHTITVTGTAPVAVEVSGLPPGVVYDDATRKISGKPTATGSFIVTMRAMNGVAYGEAQVTPVDVINPPLQFTTFPPLSPPLPVLVPALLLIEAAGGLKPYAFELAAGALPPGMGLGRQGQIGGVPTTPGTYAFTVRVRDVLFNSVTQDYELVVGSGSGPGGVVLTLDLAPNPAIVGQVVVVTATAASLAGTPTGTVDLWVAAKDTRCPDPFETGSAPVTSLTRNSALSSAGTAPFVFDDLGPGSYRVCARYNGPQGTMPVLRGPVDLFVIKGVLLDGTKADGDPQPIPASGAPGLALVALLVALAGARRLRRRGDSS